MRHDERQRARRIVSQRNLSALGNDTKWQEFFSEIIAKKLPLDIKLIDGPEIFQCERVWSPSKNYVEGSGMGLYPFTYVEQVASLRASEIADIAKFVGLEFIIDGGRVTVYGYK